MKNINIYRDNWKVDIKVINDFEEKVNIKFPFEYKELISIHNGLVPSEPYFSFEKENNYYERDISFLSFSWDICDLATDDIKNYIVRSEDNPIPSNIIIFGHEASGDKIAFDYRESINGNNPKIIYVFHDYYDNNYSEFKNGYYKTALISNSFNEFINSLYQVED